MNGLPYYKRYPRDFIEGTVGMTFETKAAYSLVLDLIYMHGGRLPDDSGYISGLLGCHKRKWFHLRKAVLETGKIELADGYLRNKRADNELLSLRQLRDKQSQNRSRPNKTNGLQSPKPNHTEPDTEPDTEISKNRARAKMLGREFEEIFWPQWPHKVGKPRARTAWAAARGKAEVREIMAGVASYVQNKPDDRQWLNPATFLNQERWADIPAGNGSGGQNGTESLPKWEGPPSLAAQRLLRERLGLHPGSEGDGQARSERDDEPVEPSKRLA